MDDVIDRARQQGLELPFPYKFRGMYLTKRLHNAIARWVVDGDRPGGFLWAVLENNLKEAVGRADDEHMESLPAIVAYIYNHTPSACWGSPEEVKAWAELHAAKRRTQEGDNASE